MFLKFLKKSLVILRFCCKMKYLFILGRNPKLSLEEIKSFFKREENKILDYSLEKNGLLIDLENPITICRSHFRQMSGKRDHNWSFPFIFSRLKK